MSLHDVEFNVIMDGSYGNVPHAGERGSNFIDLPNKYYEPINGQRAIEDWMDTLIRLEKFGYDGIVVSEQHNGPIGLAGNPMMAAAWLGAQTSRINVIVNGPIINAYASPLRLAEEISFLSVLTRGRLIVGLPMGHGMQHHSLGYINPAKARARFREAHDLLMAAFEREGPFEWKGEFFNVPYVNLWPKPVVMPQFMLPGGGSRETLELAAKNGYSYQGILTPRNVALKNLETFRQLCRDEGYEPAPHQSSGYMSIHVAETDEQARREAEDHELWTYQNFFRSPNHDNFPAGYVSSASIRGMLSSKGYRSTPMEEMTVDDLEANHWLIYGSPDTVYEKLKASLEESKVGRLIIAGNFGTKPRWLAEKSLQMFAEEVMPRFRKSSKTDDLPGYSTYADYAEKRDPNSLKPTILKDGKLQPVSTTLID